MKISPILGVLRGKDIVKPLPIPIAILVEPKVNGSYIAGRSRNPNDTII